MIDTDSQPAHVNLERHMGFCHNNRVWPKELRC
ncbi:hypothetical protein MOLA814_00462 [Betaproteobacteria bacterium MOLA814]|jgi:hypothetical protein|nr:hypothetical protein MOLA814_00462 [Betaproteobacteria bacterium MOLA814]